MLQNILVVLIFFNTFWFIRRVKKEIHVQFLLFIVFHNPWFVFNDSQFLFRVWMMFVEIVLKAFHDGFSLLNNKKLSHQLYPPNWWWVLYLTTETHSRIHPTLNICTLHRKIDSCEISFRLVMPPTQTEVWFEIRIRKIYVEPGTYHCIIYWCNVKHGSN